MVTYGGFALVTAALVDGTVLGPGSVGAQLLVMAVAVGYVSPGYQIRGRRSR